MGQRLQRIALLVICLDLTAGCATTQQPPRHRYIVSVDSIGAYANPIYTKPWEKMTPGEAALLQHGFEQSTGMTLKRKNFLGRALTADQVARNREAVDAWRRQKAQEAMDQQLKMYGQSASVSAQSPDPRKSYILLPGDNETPSNDLHFQEFAAYVDRALAYRGFVHVENSDEAVLAIYLVYGIGDPQQRVYSYSVPQWGQTGVRSATIHGDTISFTPDYGITGYATHVQSYTTYSRYVILDTYDLEVYRNQKEFKPLWRTTVTSTGPNDDLRQVFPALIAFSRNFFGTNTGQKVEGYIYEDDPRVLEIKGITQGEAK